MQRLKMLGGASIELDGALVSGRATQRRRLAMLAVLAATRNPVSREKLAGLVWPEAETERSRHLLSDSVYRIGQDLGAEVFQNSPAGLRLNPTALSSDVTDFEEALARGDDQEATRLYQGPFLDGFFLSEAPEFDRWVEERRSELARAAGGALERLAEKAELAGDRRAAIEWWRRLAALDRHSSRVATHLIEALDRAGDRSAALQHARLFQQLLAADLEVGPDPMVEALAERLKRAPVEREPASEPRQLPATPPRSAPVASAPVTGSAPAESVPRPVSDEPHPRRGRRHRRLIGVAGVIAVALGGWWIWRGTNRVDPSGPISILVLPFVDLSPPHQAEHLSDGIAEELITSLGAIESLKVVARTSAFAWKGRQVDVREIARQLGANWVVEGSVRQYDRRLRVSVRLIGAEDGYQIWTEDFDRQLGDAFQIQREIAGAVVARLRGAPAAAELAPPHPVDFEAYNAYLKGRFAWHQRTEASLRDAVTSFRSAVTRAPDYAPAYAGLGDAYAVMGYYDYLPPAEAFPEARAAAARALALDSTLAAPHATLGYVALYYDWDQSAAEAWFRRSIAIDPSYSTGYQWLGNLLMAVGRFDAAAAAMKRATELDPLSLVANAAVGWVDYLAGRYPEAIAQLRRTLALNPSFQLAHLWLGQAAGAAEIDSVAFPALEEAVRLSGNGAIQLAELAYALAARGRPDSAGAVLRAIERRGQGRRYLPAYELGKGHLALGETTTGIDWLKRALRERSHSMVFLEVDPELARWREEPWFRSLVRRVGF